MQATKKRPHIVLVLADNLGWGELGCYGGGALRGGKEVISAVLRDTRQGKWDDSMLLLSYGLQKLIDGPASPTAAQ